MNDEVTILKQLQRSDIKAFKLVYMEFIAPLDELAYALTKDHNRAREIVDEVLGNSWNNGSILNISLPIFNYLSEEVRKSANKNRYSKIKS